MKHLPNIKEMVSMIKSIIREVKAGFSDLARLLYELKLTFSNPKCAESFGRVWSSLTQGERQVYVVSRLNVCVLPLTIVLCIAFIIACVLMVLV